MTVRHGRLRAPDEQPSAGEVTEQLGRIGTCSLEQILSARLDEPVSFLQDHDEWVLLLAGGAVLEVDGEALVLAAGDWVLIPKQTPHRLLRADAGTSWLAVHADS